MTFPNTWNFVKNAPLLVVMKHGLSCLICYIQNTYMHWFTAIQFHLIVNSRFLWVFAGLAYWFQFPCNLLQPIRTDTLFLSPIKSKDSTTHDLHPFWFPALDARLHVFALSYDWFTVLLLFVLLNLGFLLYNTHFDLHFHVLWLLRTY